jgi:hypothetical protein
MRNIAKAKRHSVAITVQKGRFSYIPASFFVKRGDIIEWRCKYPFAIDLGWESPLHKERHKVGPKRTIGDRVRSDAPYGRYKYFVAVWDGKNIWTDDPEFIVRRDG